MTIANVDSTTLNNLTPNLDVGDVADPALRLEAFQYIYAKMQDLVTEVNNIPTANIQNLSITAAKLADLAVTTGKIADLAVATAKLQDASVTLAKMAANSVGTSQLVDASVTAAKVMDGVLTASKFVAGALTNETQNGLRITALEADYAKQVEVIFNPVGYGAIADGVTNNTAIVQTTVDAAGLVKGRVYIPEGVKFVLEDLVLPEDVYMTFRASDAGLSTLGGMSSTQEWVNFSNNANGAGAVNEWWFASPFHPGIIINNLKNINPGNLGSGQNQDYSISSIVFADESVNRWQLVERGQDGFSLSMWEFQFTITGINSTSFTTPPAVGTEVTSSSGGKGVVVFIDATQMIVRHLGGNFLVGDTVSDSNETTTATIATVSDDYLNRINRWIASVKNRGNIGINIPGDNAIHSLTVGGVLGIENSRGGSYGTAKAAINLADDLSNPTNRKRITFDPVTGDLVIYATNDSAVIYRLTNAGVVTYSTIKATSSIESATIFLETPATGTSPKIITGTGSPEGVVAAGIGSLYTNKSGGASTTLYVKTSGSGSTGWTAK